MEPLAPGMRRTGKVMRRMPGASISKSTPQQIDRNGDAHAPELMASILMGKKPKGVVTEDRTVDGIPIRIYGPTGASTSSASGVNSLPESKPLPELVEGPTANRASTSSASGVVDGPAALPLIVYFHGGGFVYGDLRGGDWICGTVAKDLGAVVVSIDYRLAPKNPFPAGVDDCYAMLVWAAENAASLGADAARLGVMGESAGGNLAAVVALMARDRKGPVIRHQALLYPATGGGDTESRRANADAFILTAADMQKFGELYGGDDADWRVSPLRAESLTGLPPALVEVAGHDPLHDDGVLYADALRKAGVEVELIDYPSMPHGFLNFPRFARDAKAGIAAVVEAQRAVLSPTN